MNLHRVLLSGLMIVACFTFVMPVSIVAQDGNSSADDETEFDAAEWLALVQKKADAVAQIEKLVAEFQVAEPADKARLQADSQALSKKFQTEILSQMVKLAPLAYAKNPQDINAAEIMMQVTYSKNQFGQAAEVADVILQNDPTHALALNVSGVSHFAIHDFEEAVELLEQAEQLKVLYPQLGGHYLDTARDYIDYWKVEQEIRAKEAAATGQEQLPHVLMKTSQGDILLELFENEAPNTVANFISLVESGYYDGVAFHRVINSFMAQGGRKSRNDNPIDYTINCECYREDARRHFAGSISMAHAGRDTGGAQFFLTHLPTAHLDEDVRPESVHTVFGRVVEGMDAVAALQVGDKIISATVVRKRDHEYQPETHPSLR